MVIDTLNSIALYESLGINADILAQIKPFMQQKPGRYELDNGYVMVQTGTTNPIDTGKFEAHKKYIDLQIMLDGSEFVEWSNLASLTCDTPYDNEKDFALYTGIGTTIQISAGMFYILLPSDGHKPCCHINGQQSDYRKLVVKIPIKN